MRQSIHAALSNETVFYRKNRSAIYASILRAVVEWLGALKQYHPHHPLSPPTQPDPDPAPDPDSDSNSNFGSPDDDDDGDDDGVIRSVFDGLQFDDLNPPQPHQYGVGRSDHDDTSRVDLLEPYLLSDRSNELELF